MVVQHNLTAMNSNRMLNVTTKSQAKSTEKLSSGYKINRAADDAAGLSISEKMRKQIRGLTQASNNAQDGISCVQTAEGALNEVQDMLQRMNELAVKAANGTNSSDDRNYIQNEIEQLVSEVDRVAATTKFNETYLLKGDSDATKEWEFGFTQVDGVKAGNLDLTSFNATTAGTGVLSGKSDGDSVYLLYDNGTNGFKNLEGGAAVAVADAGLDGTSVNLEHGDVIKLTKTASGATAEIVSEADQYGVKLYDATGNRVPHNKLEKFYTATDGTPATVAYNGGLYLDEAATVELAKSDAVIKDEISAARNITGALSLDLHVGADATSNNQIELNITALTARGLGVEGLTVAGPDSSNALYSMTVISEAIQKISTQRSSLGAIQNRLDHTISNLDNVVENTTSAESSIRDTDMATEMVRYSNNNILAQAGQAMLAQANQSNQGVLSLLQG